MTTVMLWTFFDQNMSLEENARSANGSAGQQAIEDDPERTYEALKQDDELDVAQPGTVCGFTISRGVGLSSLLT